MFNLMEWSIGLGMSVGPMVGSLLVGWSGHNYFSRPFLVIITVFSLLWCLFFQSSSVNVDNYRDDKSTNNGGFLLYLTTWLCFMFAWQGYFHWFPSLMYTRFHFTHAKLSVFYTVLGVFYIVSQLFIVNVFTRWNIHRKVVVTALPVLSFSFLIMAMTSSVFVMYIISAVYMLAISFFLPFWKAYLSLKEQWGFKQLFTKMTIATSLCAVGSSALGGFFSTFSLGVTFVIFSLFMLLAVIFFLQAERSRCSQAR